MAIIQCREDEKGEGEFKKGGGKSVNWLINYFPLFSSVFSSLSALIFSSLTNFPPFFAFEFEFNSIEYNSRIFPRNKKLADLNLKATFEKKNLVTKRMGALCISTEF